ncbi:nucleoside deaminase [Streptomyces sp. TRM66268-LWL]|uniref:Nucleoside deaminase n=1 Tax=Streptomyces polyasparticus TaxID=2767826 RepID=A0ABR7SKR3_9ACTN|nr:nucleoside deaminase [Streptomyces polyasparticus]MBC9715544.1 nucleoside deaminase [Streptomyces polyasparticus]
MADDFATAWQALDPAARRCLELAHTSLRNGGLACGAVLTDASGAIVAEGRNRAYDPPGGSDPLQGTPLAHAETNALARARTEWDLAAHTLWSSLEPCAMCTAAAEFTGVGTVRYVARDPWAVAGGLPVSPGLPLNSPVWAVSSALLFLRGVYEMRGPDAEVLRAYERRAPEVARLVADPAFERADGAGELFGVLWSRIREAAGAAW